MMKNRVMLAVLVMTLVARATTCQTVDDEIKAKQKAIAELKQQLAPQLQPLLVRDADVRLWVSNTIPGKVADVFNSLTPAQRRLHYDATSEAGQLKNSNGGALGCGWYVTFEGGNSAHADLDLSQLTLGSSGSSIPISFNYHVDLNAQVHGHVKGPAGPCSFWHPWPTCDCPIWGGVGTSVGAYGEKGGTIGGRFDLSSDAKHWLLYGIVLTGPAQISITVNLRNPIPNIPDAGFPTHFDLPLGLLLTGSAPDVFQGDGEIKVGTPPILDRKYQISVQPQPLLSDATGFAVKARVNISWN